MFLLRNISTSLLVQDPVMAGYLFPKALEHSHLALHHTFIMDSINSEMTGKNHENCSVQFDTDQKTEAQ